MRGPLRDAEDGFTCANKGRHEVVAVESAKGRAPIPKHLSRYTILEEYLPALRYG